MKTEYRDHPLGTAGGSARRKAASEQPDNPLVRWLARLLLGSQAPGRSWEKGAQGEELVARKLAKLSRDLWMPLHDRPLGERGRNVDHLVIGLGGVFAINTKNLGGRVRVDKGAFLVGGFPDPCLHVARDEAARVAERLTIAVGAPVPVAPVIVVLAPSVEVVEQPEGVHVLAADDVPRWFETRPEALDRAIASRIYTAARSTRVWTEPVAALRAAAGGPAVTASVWKRFGQDRVYVNDAAGSTLGHLDRKTGEIHVKDVARQRELQSALAPYLDAR
ncbi:MAG: NERD domain-containing protein [Actinomycetota bacterium]|nr:NERD domain-containing protein [Actinomycetota bacterium]